MDDVVDEEIKLFMRSAIKGDLDGLTRAHSRGVDVDATAGKFNDTAAILAAMSGHDHIIDYLAKVKADLNKPDIFGHPPIAHAIFSNNVSCIMALYAHGVSLDFSDREGNSIIDLCIDSACVDQQTTDVVLELFHNRAA